MKKLLFPLAAAAALTATAGIAHADVALYAKGGTLGLGAGVGFTLTDTLNARVGYNAYTFDKDIDETDVSYDGEIKFKSGELLLDWHPFNGSFRVTAGAYLNKNEINGSAKPSNGTYEINDVTYNAADVGRLDANIDFKNVSPYIGIGWGNFLDKDGHFTFTTDIGALYQGSPNVHARVTCGAGLSSGDCAQLNSDVAAEAKDLEQEIDSYKWWPVLSIGLAYRF